MVLFGLGLMDEIRRDGSIREANWRDLTSSWYTIVMIETFDLTSCVVPSASPTEADISGWQGLDRDEQLRRLRAKLSHPDCAAVSDASMSEIVGRAQASLERRRD